MNNAECYHLKWDNFENNLKGNYKELRSEHGLCDITLISGDGQFIEAHKIVLALSSTMFKDILNKKKQVYPSVVYLRGISSFDLELILDFMYYGEVKVLQDHLTNFLEAAKDIGVKGLMEKKEYKQVPNLIPSKKKRLNPVVSLSTASSCQFDNRETIPMKFKNELAPNSAQFNIDYEFMVDNIKFEDIIKEDLNDMYNHEEIINSVVDADGSKLEYKIVNSSVVPENKTNDDLDSKIEEMIFVENGCWGCKVCGKVMRKKQHIKNHAESHLVGYSHPCPYCGKCSKTRNALTNHISYFHKHPLSKMPMQI